MFRLVPPLLLCLAVACSPPETAADVEDFERMSAGLCTAIEADLATSESVFHRDSHQQLHVLASRLAEDDQAAVASELLVAKQRVEASYDQGLPADVTMDNLRSLVTATNIGLALLDLPTNDCEGRTS